MKQLSLLAFLLVLLVSACGDDDDDGDLLFDRIARIGRADGWRLASVDSDFDARVNAAIDGLTDEQIAADTRTRDDLRQQYSPFIRAATTVDECDRDDILFFVQNGAMRIIGGDVECPVGGDPSPILRFNDRTYTTDGTASELTVRASSGELTGVYEIFDLTDEQFNFGTEVEVQDSIFTDLTYSIRYNLVAN